MAPSPATLAIKAGEALLTTTRPHGGPVAVQHRPRIAAPPLPAVGESGRSGRPVALTVATQSVTGEDRGQQRAGNNSERATGPAIGEALSHLKPNRFRVLAVVAERPKPTPLHKLYLPIERHDLNLRLKAPEAKSRVRPPGTRRSTSLHRPQMIDQGLQQLHDRRKALAAPCRSPTPTARSRVRPTRNQRCHLPPRPTAIRPLIRGRSYLGWRTRQQW